MFLDHGRPVAARFRDANRKNTQPEFLDGASVMHSRVTKLVVEKEAIFDEFTESDNEGKIAACGVKAYVWNPHTRTFDLNISLSRSATDEFCRTIRADQ